MCAFLWNLMRKNVYFPDNKSISINLSEKYFMGLFNCYKIKYNFNNDGRLFLNEIFEFLKI